MTTLYFSDYILKVAYLLHNPTYRLLIARSKAILSLFVRLNLVLVRYLYIFILFFFRNLYAFKFIYFSKSIVTKS